MKFIAFLAFLLLISTQAFSQADYYGTLETPETPIYVNSGIGTNHALAGKVNAFYAGGIVQLFQFKEHGYYQYTDHNREINLFVPPMESQINERTDMMWYRTQFNTVTPSNCGPSSLAMAIQWATGENVDVYDIRRMIGWSGIGAGNDEAIIQAVNQFMANQATNPFNGGTAIGEITYVLDQYHIQYRTTPIHSKADLDAVIDRGNIAIVLFKAGEISYSGVRSPKSFYGRYYDYTGGHYLVLKGRSLNNEFFIVSDPMPSDWVANSFRYDDGISMIGRTRYYDAVEFLRGIQVRYPHVIEIFPTR